MKVLVVADGFPLISETFIVNHITSLLERGIDVTILARRPTFETGSHPAVDAWKLRERTIYFNMPVSYRHRIKAVVGMLTKPHLHVPALSALNILRYGYGVLNLHSAFRASARPKGPFDIVHCHYGHIAASCLNLKYAYGAKFFASFHGYEFTKRISTRPFIYKRLFVESEKLIANSDYSRQKLLALGCPSSKIEKLPVFPEPYSNEEAAFRHNLGNPLRLLTVARLDKAKGVQYAIKAVRLLMDKNILVQYTIVGEGPYRNTLQRLVDDLGVGNCVTFRGWMDQGAVRKQYQENSVFILASIDIGDGGIETQGLVLQEAKQFGLLALGSDLGGIPEGLDYGKAGVLCAPADAVDIARNLEWTVNNPEAAMALAEAGQSHYLAHFAKAAVTDRLISLYAESMRSRKT